VRAWNSAIAALADHVRGGVPTLVFLSLLAALLVALGWYYWPRWLPQNWRFGSFRRDRRSGSRGWRGRFRLGALRWRWRLRWRKRRRRGPDDLLDLPPDELPDLPAAVLALTADQLAAAGRYAEAVRERLRAMVRLMIERGVIPFSPGWTVTELAAAAGRVQPSLTAPLGGAVAIFSEIWYGLRPARPEDDAAMRGHAEAVARSVPRSAPVGASS
jgi:hypothetical protein